MSVLPAALVVLLVTACDPVGSSHIAGNVPAKNNFDDILSRDLYSYFSSRMKAEVHVHHELLRKQPTQTGIAYPKFYVWVTVQDQKREDVLAEGAVRVAAIARIRFEVTHFVDKKSARSDLNSIYEVFPAAVCNEIRRRL